MRVRARVYVYVCMPVCISELNSLAAILQECVLSVCLCLCAGVRVCMCTCVRVCMYIQAVVTVSVETLVFIVIGRSCSEGSPTTH